MADYIPALAQASPDLFGVAIAGVHGQVAGVGDSAHPFTIQSVAKPFLFALVCEALGHREVRHRLGVNATGLPFDSVMAVELATEGLTNPMVNSGAIATTSLAPGRTATLADGGVNPVTHRRVVSEDTCRRTLALMLTAGMYERSGEWLYEIGLPAKSGVSGGIITIAPGKGGLATFSPPLDPAGNSVRGQLVTKLLSEALGLDILASSPVPEAPKLQTSRSPLV